MSKEFEEIVLKKLDTLENQTSNTDRVIEKVILKKLDTMENTMQSVVLKKLDALETKTSNTDKVIEEVILKKLEKLDAMEDTMQNVVLKKLDALETKTSNTDKVIEEVVLKKLDVLDERTKNTDKELKTTQEIVKKLNDSFTVFDFEINKKIDTLFDAITVNNEKHDLFEKSIVSLNKKTFNHDIRISVLEDYNKNDKLFVTN